MNESLLANKLGALVVAVSDRLRDVETSAHAMTLTLHHHGPMTVTELAAVVGLSQPAATRALQDLRRDDLVEATVDRGRQRPVRLTVRGTAAARSLEEARRARLLGCLGALEPTDHRVLDGLLTRLLEGMTPDQAGARRICRLCDHALCDGPDCPVGSRARTLDQAEGGG